jgi:hypothetical protein
MVGVFAVSGADASRCVKNAERRLTQVNSPVETLV